MLNILSFNEKIIYIGDIMKKLILLIALSVLLYSAPGNAGKRFTSASSKANTRSQKAESKAARKAEALAAAEIAKAVAEIEAVVKIAAAERLAKLQAQVEQGAQYVAAQEKATAEMAAKAAADRKMVAEIKAALAAADEGAPEADSVETWGNILAKSPEAIVARLVAKSEAQTAEMVIQWKQALARDLMLEDQYAAQYPTQYVAAVEEGEAAREAPAAVRAPASAAGGKDPADE